MKLLKNMTAQVLLAIVAAALFGYVWPSQAVALKPLGDAYIRLIKMVIGPVIFLTITTSIAAAHNLKQVGRVAGKALLYFEVMSTISLAIGLVVANVISPGSGVGKATDLDSISSYVTAAKQESIGDFLLHVLPDNAVAAFATGDILQILVFALLFGSALAMLGAKAAPIVNLFEQLAQVFFQVVALVVRVAPIGAFGAMAYTTGKFGIGALSTLAKLMGSVYLTMFLFVFIVLGLVARLAGFRILALLKHIREEILVVLGTSSSESALPSVMKKLESFGCSREIVSLVIPTGYSFNLDGTSIYLAMATLFIAQAYGIDLSLQKQILLLGVLMVTSKGAAGVTGSGFVTLAATLAATGTLPVEGMALLLGVDRFMSEARAITNLIGNSVATVVVARLEGAYQPTHR